MNGWRLAVFLIGAIPFALSMGFGLVMTMGMNETIAIVDGKEDVDTPGLNIIGSVLGKITELRENAHADRVFNTTELTQRRAISYSRSITIEDVLAEGEAMPDPSLHDLYVTARAARALTVECPAILATLATSCKPAEVRVDKRDNGMFDISGMLAFTPSTPPGTPTAEGELVYTVHRTSLDFGDANGIETTEGGISAARSEYYTRAEQACEAVRKTMGMCLIEEMKFKVRKDRRSEMYRVSVEAKLSSMGVQGASQGKFADIVERIEKRL